MQNTDIQVMRALMNQVCCAVASVEKKTGDKISELDIVTFVTRPMWQAWLRALCLPEDSEPTGWIGEETVRVFGSRTVIVESTATVAVSLYRYSECLYE